MKLLNLNRYSFLNLFLKIIFIVEIERSFCKNYDSENIRAPSLNSLQRSSSSSSGVSKAFLGVCSNGSEMSWEKSNAQTKSFEQNVLNDQLTLYNNVFGADLTSSGSKQTTGCTKFESSQLSWKTKFLFNSISTSNDKDVKSYSNICLKSSKNVQIKSLKTLSTVWNWDLTESTSDLVADVSYDIFTSLQSDCSGQSGGCASHELMFWLLAKGGARPSGQSTGKFVSVGSGSQSFQFEVWNGTVGGIPVISLIPKDADLSSYKAFSGDLKKLIQEDLAPFGLSPDEYISTFGAGVEPFKGGGTVTTSAYEITLN